ncbi:MAG TPA: beta-mannosidase [Streptosporangiaceae bacterium]
MRSSRRGPSALTAAAAATLALLPAVLPGGPARALPASASQAGASLAGAGASTARPGRGIASLISQATARLGTPSDTGSSDVVNLGSGGWRVASSATAAQSGAVISQPGFHAGGWLPVRNDAAGAPGTEIEALLQNADCPGDPGLPVNQRSGSRHSVFYGTNMKKCYGYMSHIGKDTVPRFSVPWWWRTDFTAPSHPGPAAAQQRTTLIVNGVIGRAAVWVNGHRVATPATVTGAYTRFSFGIGRLLRPGTNTVAIEVQPNDPDTMYTVDDVDWNQIPPDNNTGIQFPVQLQVAGPLADGNAHLTEANSPGLTRSALTVRADISNPTASTQSGTFGAAIAAPGGHHQTIVVSSPVTVPAGATRTVTLRPAQYPALTINHPSVWWPYRMGGQPLYTLVTWVAQHGRMLNSTHEQFGIRTVTSYLTGKSPQAPAGARVFTINGRRFVVRGGGFSPNIFLHYSAAGTARQVALLKNLGLNTLRLEGHIMPDNFFTQMDRAGILVNAGYQCCDAWQLPSDGHGVTNVDYRLLRLSALTLGERLRNHPSVDSFQWSDNPPIPRQEKVSLAGFRQAGFGDPLISSAEYNSSPVLGASGEKEGPYDWVPPSYWYDTSHYNRGDSTRTNVGGAWAYDSEESAGDTVPTLYSLRRFMSPHEQAQLWKNPGYNQYHANYEPGHHGYQFGTLFNFDAALAARYGPWSSLAGYVEKAQLQNYENTRAQFEAYLAHAGSKPTPSTGTVYWQVNKGWPSLLWNLYNSDGDQAGAYFGAQEANRALHVLYTLDTGTVTVDNLTGARQSGLTVQARVYSLSGRLLDDQRSGPLTLASQQVAGNVLKPKVPAASKPATPARVYFVELLLRRHGAVIDRNVYWLSTHPDVVNWAKSTGAVQATMTSYANLRALNSLPAATARTQAVTTKRNGALVTRVTITNTSGGSTAALFLRADVLRGTRDGRVLPGDSELQSATWNGDDVTLWPGESQTLTVRYRAVSLRGATPVIRVSGWNVAPRNTPAPAR